jgi:AhpD family alkylhydroperoxidase
MNAIRKGGKNMEARIRYAIAAPGVYKAMLQLEEYVQNCGLEKSLLRLIEMRASQINGCAFCLDMHSKDARADGETEQRLYVLAGWREAPFYSERERAALEWTEAVTLVADGHVPDEVYERVRPHFTDEELANLTLAINAINSWNRLNVAFRTPAGTYRPKQTAHS